MKRKPGKTIRKAPESSALFFTQYYIQFVALVSSGSSRTAGTVSKRVTKKARYLGSDGKITTDRDRAAIFPSMTSARDAATAAQSRISGASDFTISSRKVIAGKRHYQ